MCPKNVWTLCNIELNHQDERMVSGSIIGGTTTSSWLQGRAHAWGTEVSGGGGEVGLGGERCFGNTQKPQTTLETLCTLLNTK